MLCEDFEIGGNDLNVSADTFVQAALSDAFGQASGPCLDNDGGALSAPNTTALEASHSTEVLATIISVLDTAP